MSIAEKLTTVAENIQKVYEAGKRDAGQGDFWGAYQDNGERNDYTMAFGGIGWDNTVFKPEYDIHVRIGNNMFFRSSVEGDLADLLDDLGVNFDTSPLINPQYMFAYSKFSRVGTIDVRNVTLTTYGYWFYASTKLVTIDKLISSENTAYTNSNFMDCTALKNLTVEGTIANTVNFQWCPLSPESMLSIIHHLKDYTGTGKEYSATLTFSDACWNNLNASTPVPDGWGDDWRFYVNEYLCWNT